MAHCLVAWGDQEEHADAHGCGGEIRPWRPFISCSYGRGGCQATPLTKQEPLVLQVLCLCRFRARTCLRNLASPLGEDTAFAGFTTVRNAETSMTLAHTTSFFCRKNGSSAAASANRASLLTSYLRSRFTFLNRCNNGTYSRFHVYLVNGLGCQGVRMARELGFCCGGFPLSNPMREPLRPHERQRRAAVRESILRHGPKFSCIFSLP